MANEAVLLFETGHAIPFTCADGTGIEKGAILTLSNPMTVATSTTQNAAVGGIAAAEKIANDGCTKIPVFRSGIFKVYASGSVVTGGALKISADDAAARNYIAAAAADDEDIIGIALEDATVGQTFKMELRPTAVEQA